MRRGRAVGVAGYDLFQLQKGISYFRAQTTGTTLVNPHVGPGLVIVVIGGVLVAAGGALGWITMPED